MAATENSRLITSKDALYAVKNCLFCIDHKWNKEKMEIMRDGKKYDKERKGGKKYI